MTNEMNDLLDKRIDKLFDKYPMSKINVIRTDFLNVMMEISQLTLDVSMTGVGGGKRIYETNKQYVAYLHWFRINYLLIAWSPYLIMNINLCNCICMARNIEIYDNITRFSKKYDNKIKHLGIKGVKCLKDVFREGMLFFFLNSLFFIFCFFLS